MNILDNLLGGGGKEAQAKMPGYAKEYGTALSAAKRAALDELFRIYNAQSGPYPTYPAPRIAKTSTTTKQGWKRGKQARQTWAPGMSKAERLAGLDPTVMGNVGGIEALTNPYTEQVIERTLADMSEQNEAQRLADQARAGAKQAYGGARHGVVDAMREGRFTKAVGDVSAGLRERGYNTALAALQADLDRRLRGAETASGVAGRRAGLERDYWKDLLGIGGMQEGVDQRSLDLAYNDWLRQQNWPKEQFGFLQAGLNEQPFNPAQYQYQVPGQPSTMQQLTGLGIAGIGTAGVLGWRPFA